MTALYGILGDPVAHSRSPAMHNAAFAALGIDATYLRFHVTPQQLPVAVRGLVALGIQGASVTVPHKERILPLLDEVTPQARAIGAVNTIVRRGDALAGHNTDAAGLVCALEEQNVQLAGANIAIFGAGGAARASVVGLAGRGAAKIVIFARQSALAASLIADVRGACGATELVARPWQDTPLREVLSETDLLVQATSATLGSGPDSQAFARAVPLDVMRARSCVIDLVYKPLETALLARARERQLRALDGLGMLLHQGALAFALWTNKEPPLAVMRSALGQP
jgi:shikimate dehydrogenase